MSFSILLSPTAKLMSVSTECAAALLSFRYPSINYALCCQVEHACITSVNNLRVCRISFKPI